MALPRQTEMQRPAPRLYLITPPLGDTASLRESLGAALAAADVAAVLLVLAHSDERTMINQVKALAPIVQEKGVALLLDQPDIVARAGADGAHVAGIDALKDAIETLKPDRIVGAGDLRTRHDAMLAGEANVDYVLFGEPNGGGRRPSFDVILERVEWWAELFELPCVGFAATLDEVRPLAAAGADFIAVGDCVWNDSRGVAAAMAAATDALVTETIA